MIIFICRCRAAFSHTAFRLSIIAVVYVSSNYHFIILMPNVSSHAGVGWEKRQIHSTEKGRERRSNASVDCNSELAFYLQGPLAGCWERSEQSTGLLCVFLCAVLWLLPMYATGKQSAGIKKKIHLPCLLCALSPEC